MTDETVPQPLPGSMAEQGSLPRLPQGGGPDLLVVSLVGFMGAGKTTVGHALASRLGWRFADLDDLIQSREGRSIEQIFQQQGESRFRDLERVVIREMITAKSTSLVFAMGGGAFIEEPVQEILRAAEVPAVFLDAPVEELFRRSEQPEVIRPLRGDREQFRQLYERRRPEYLKAELRIETGGKTIAMVVEEIISGLNLVARSDPESGARR